MKLQEPIASQRVVLSTFTEEKVCDKYLEWLRNSEINRYLEVRHQKIDLINARDFVRKHSESQSSMFLLVETIDGTLIGTCTLFFSFVHRVAEIGIMIGDSQFQGKGYASEVIQLLENLAANFYQVRKITAGVYSSNVKSKNLFERNGFQLEALLKREVIFDGKEEDVLRFSKFTSPSNPVN
jgi:[ribosomal protein S5]-alanine N-acetyltransferase